MVHRRYAEEHRRAGSKRESGRPRLEAHEVAQLPAATQRAKETQHEAVDVQERQRVSEDVCARPVPGARQRVEIGADRSPWQHGPLGGPVVPDV